MCHKLYHFIWGMYDGFIGQKILKLWRQESQPFGPNPAQICSIKISHRGTSLKWLCLQSRIRKISGIGRLRGIWRIHGIRRVWRIWRIQRTWRIWGIRRIRGIRRVWRIWRFWQTWRIRRIQRSWRIRRNLKNPQYPMDLSLPSFFSIELNPNSYCYWSE